MSSVPFRIRAQSPTGDYTFGQSAANFITGAAAVAQLILTRLQLMQGSWFLNNQAGTPYNTQILGVRTKNTYDQAIKAVILGTPNVLSITQYTSQVVNRALSVTALQVNTTYGPVTVTTPFTVYQTPGS